MNSEALDRAYSAAVAILRKAHPNANLDGVVLIAELDRQGIQIAFEGIAAGELEHTLRGAADRLRELAG